MRTMKYGQKNVLAKNSAAKAELFFCPKNRGL